MPILEDVVQLLKESAERSHVALPPGIGDAEIRDFQMRTGLTVPASLREWLAITNGPSVGEWLYGVRPKKRSLDIEHILRLYPAWLREGWIPVANDGCGDYYVLATQAEDGPGNPVFFIENHEDEDKPKYVAASDLWHFLYFLLDDSLHHDPESAEPAWPFSEDFVLARDAALRDYRTVPRPWEVGPY
jgi:cell wall assembly regulator SMI1